MSDESQVAIGPYERTMPLNEAFIVLGITDESDTVTDDVIIYSYQELVQNTDNVADRQAAAQPTRLEEFKKALEVIADHRDSISLKTFLIDLNTGLESLVFCLGSADDRTRSWSRLGNSSCWIGERCSDMLHELSLPVLLHN